MSLERFTKQEIIGALPDGSAAVIESKILADRKSVKDAIKDANRDWCDRVKAEMKAKGVSTTDMAMELGYTRAWVSNVINGGEASTPTKKRVEEFLGITGDGHDGTPAKKLPDR